MSGLEIPAFIIGLSGLAAVFDKTIIIWRTISSASDYGEEITGFMSQLEIEFFKFQTWWAGMESLAADIKNRRSTYIQVLPASSPLIQYLQSYVRPPISDAASHVLQILEEIQGILVRNKVIDTAKLYQGQTQSTTATESTLQSSVMTSHATHIVLAQSLNKGTSWFRRFKSGATPWREDDKTKLKNKIKEMKYWNTTLYAILPSRVRESILEQGYSGYILKDSDDAEDIVAAQPMQQDESLVLLESAELLAVRQRLKNRQLQDYHTEIQKVLDKTKKSGELFEQLPEVYNTKRPFSVIGYKADGQTAAVSSLEIQVLVEWYPFPESQAGIDTWVIAQRRISLLSYLLQARKKPSTLHALHTLGFIENRTTQCFGLVYEIPKWASTTIEPITLYHLLAKQIPSPASSTTPTSLPSLPSLEKRFEIAALLASTLYTFMLTRWHHKRYHSSNVFFLCPRHASPQDAAPALSNPYIGGFVVSRSDSPTDISLPSVPPKDAEMYLHPDLRVEPPNQPPKFKTAYDIYSFGLLLVEIGFWNTLPTIAAAGRRGRMDPSPRTQRAVITKKCTTDLACWMGERYRDATLRCLNVENVDEGGVGEELNDFYWQVVLELIKCVPGS